MDRLPADHVFKTPPAPQIDSAIGSIAHDFVPKTPEGVAALPGQSAGRRRRRYLSDLATTVLWLLREMANDMGRHRPGPQPCSRLTLSRSLLAVDVRAVDFARAPD
jgi:hypothetical protein